MKQNPKEYWNERFSRGGRIWGQNPSKSALYALELFQKCNIKKILIPGAGYGRNSKLFSANNFEVVGIEISEIAYNVAKDFDPKTKFILGSVLNLPFDDEIYDAIYCYNVLHLFLEKERLDFLNKCSNQIKNGGFLFFTVFSEREESYGTGLKIEEDTFESKPGRPTHYFSHIDLLEHFKIYKIIETDLLEEPEDHGALGPHIHILRYIFAQKN